MNEHSLPTVAKFAQERYGLNVAANSATGFGDLSRHWRTSAHIPAAGAFFVPAVLSYGGCARDTFGYAGFLCPRFANLRTAATHNRLATIRGSSSDKGASTMKHALNPSAPAYICNHAEAWKARAIAALHADSSLSVRLKRYNAAMARARALEVQGGAA